MASQNAVQNIIQQQVLKAAEIIEERLDEEIRNLDELKSDDIESLRERRLLQLKLQAKRKQEYLAKVTILNMDGSLRCSYYRGILVCRDMEITMSWGTRSSSLKLSRNLPM